MTLNPCHTCGNTFFQQRLEHCHVIACFEFVFIGVYIIFMPREMKIDIHIFFLVTYNTQHFSISNGSFNSSGSPSTNSTQLHRRVFPKALLLRLRKQRVFVMGTLTLFSESDLSLLRRTVLLIVLFFTSLFHNYDKFYSNVLIKVHWKIDASKRVSSHWSPKREPVQRADSYFFHYRIGR